VAAFGNAEKNGNIANLHNPDKPVMERWILMVGLFMYEFPPFHFVELVIFS